MERLDVELVSRGLARSRSQAAEMVSQRRVYLDDVLVIKPSGRVTPGALLSVTGDPADDYVGRGALKLAGFFDDITQIEKDGSRPTTLPIAGRYCLDVGASTGGFTQVLLERGARHVSAVDVGHSQLARKLRTDPRVTDLSGVNARTLRRDDIAHPVDVVVADLSFISLRLVINQLVVLLQPSGDLVVMVKPQFEVGRDRLGAGGVVRGLHLRTEAIIAVGRACLAAGMALLAVHPSRIPGANGNTEYFLWCRLVNAADASDSVHGLTDHGLLAAAHSAVQAGPE